MSTLYANLLRSWATWIEHLSVGVAIAVTSQGLVQLAAIAQITPDDSLGATPSVVVLEAPNQTLIRGGAQSGANLFHSFQDFNVGLDQQVYFANPAAIENILTRVTGSEASDILGTLGVLGNANLFLLNPNGILFGPDAQLDISGSFTASTAEGFEWANGASFSAVNPTAPPLLTVSLTPGLRYSSSGQVADITQAGTLTAGQNLMLSAGNLDLQGQLQAGQDLTLTALETLQVRDSVGEPFGAIAAQDLLIEGNQVDIFALNHTDSGFWSGGDMVLRSPHPISGDAHYQSGGLFQIEDFAGNLGALVSPNDPVIRAAGNVSFESYEGASLHVLAGGSVTIPGDIIITGPDTVANSLQETVTLSNGDVLAIDGSVTPTLDIRAGTLAAQETSITGDVDGFTPFPDINDNGDNAAIILGDISNPGGIVFLSNQHEPDPALSGDVSIGVIDLLKPEGGGSVVVDSRGVINSNQPINVSGIDPTNLSSTGNAGDIVMLATNDITLGAETTLYSEGLLSGHIAIHSDGIVTFSGSSISHRSEAEFPNNPGGDIRLSGQSVRFEEGANITAATLGTTKVSEVVITADDQVLLEGGTTVDVSGDGGGRIQIQGEKITLNDQSFIYSHTNGEQNGSEIFLQAADVIIDESSEVTAHVFGSGQGSDIQIDTERLLIQDDVLVTTNTFGTGQGGDVTVNASESVQVIHLSDEKTSTRLGALLEKGSTGSAGNLTIDTGQLLIQGGGEVRASTYGDGDSGDLTVTATESIEVTGRSTDGEFGSRLAAGPEDGTGDGGNLLINTRNLMIQGGAAVSASTFSDGNAGDLTVNATESVQVIGRANGISSNLAAQADTGKGNAGNLTINTQNLLIQDGAQVSASTFSDGDGSNITINATNSVQVIGFSMEDGQSSNLATQSNSKSTGNAGVLTINTSQLLVQDGAFISSGTRSNGNGSDLTINATDFVHVIGISPVIRSQIITGQFNNNEEDQAFGDAGNLTINTDQLLIQDGGSVASTTNDAGNGGSITIKATDSVIMQGRTVVNEFLIVSSQLLATSGGGASGAAGNIFIDTDTLSVVDDARISASTLNEVAPSSSGLELRVKQLFLDQGQLTTETFAQTGQGAEIRIADLEVLVLRNNSLISAEAFEGADGGNIRIDAPDGFIVASPGEDSDIIARANLGDGGIIEATAQSIMGLSEGAAIPGNGTNDIDASSRFGQAGFVSLNQLNPNPAQDTAELLTEPGTPQISQRCGVGEGTSSFVTTGRGGSPTEPSETVPGLLWETLDGPEALVSDPPDEVVSPLPITAAVEAASIVEAQGWTTDDEGKIVLTATVPDAIPSATIHQSQTCFHLMPDA